MTEEPSRHPDLLRRFVPAPYVFSKHDGPTRLLIESNDLEIALSVRRSDIFHRRRNWGGGLLCKLIRDVAGPVDGSEMTIVSDETLRVLYLGRGTILVHDRERSELLGFIAGHVPAEELVLSLIPAVLEG
jgi:hypothetical protein